MLKHKIKYETYDDPPEEVEEDFYFNITKTELLELEIEHKEGLDAWVKKIIKAEDAKTMWNEFKRVLLLAYGEKSADGKSFVKTPEIREAFSHTAAFNALMLNMVTDDEFAANFLKGIIPKDLSAKVDEEEAKEKANDSAPPANP